MANNIPREASKEIPSSFFKIVFNPKEHLLRLPDDFVEIYGSKIPDFTFIKVADGLEWPSKVLHSDDGIWLKGLEIFHEYYSIDLYHFMFLDYDCKSNFSIHIYDTYATEIEYPLNDSDKKSKEALGIEDVHPVGRTKGKLGKPNDDHATGTSADDSVVERENNFAYQKAKDSMANSSSIYFIAPIYPSYASYMYVPKKMEKDYLRNNYLVHLCVSGKKWPVECTFKRDLVLRGGWKDFKKENRIEVGDVCVFVIDKNNKLLWNVNIFKAMGDCSSKTMVNPRIKPSFFTVFSNDEISRRLILPSKFVGKHRQILPETVKLRISSGKIWDVTFEQTGVQEYSFTKGWSHFVKHLQFGDYIMFWFNLDKSTFDVCVLGHNACEKIISGNISSMLRKPVALRGEVTSIGEIAAQRTEKEIKWEKSWPQKEILMNENKKSRVRFPKSFAKDAGFLGKKSTWLVYPPKEKRWDVTLFERRTIYSLEMTRGWPDFWKSNGICFGKTYLFMYNPEKKVIQVKVVG